MVVRELITRLGFNLNQSQLNNAERGMQRVKDRAEQAATAFRNIATAIASIATVRTVIGIADEMQNIRARIGQLPQTVGDAGDAFKEVARHASASGSKIDAYASLYTKVGNAAKDYVTTQQDLLGITDTVSNALRVGGASTQEASAVMTQFSQALASGVLQGDEFRSMAEAAPQYLDKLAETLKIPRDQLKKMASEGKLTAKAVIEATRKMHDYFADKAKQLPSTVGLAMTIIGNRFAVLIDKMNGESHFITRIANTILSMFDKIEAGVNKLVAAFGGFGNMVRFIGIAIAAAFGTKAIGILLAFRNVAWTAALPFLKMALIIGTVALALEDLYVWIKGGDSLIGKLIGPWTEWRDYVMGAVQGVVAVFKWLWTLLGAVGATVAGVFTLDWNLFKDGLQGIGALLWGIVAQWGTWIRDAFMAAFTAVTSYVREVLVSWGAMIYDAIFTPIVNAVTNAWNAVKDIVGGAFGAVTNFLGLGSATAPTGNATTPASAVAPAQLAPSAMGAARPNVTSTTNVTVTVPPGTTAEQAGVLKKAAGETFSKGANDKLARDLSVYAR